MTGAQLEFQQYDETLYFQNEQTFCLEIIESINPTNPITVIFSLFITAYNI